MGSCQNCFIEEITTIKTETINDSNIEDFFLIQPSLLSSEIGIKRIAFKKTNPSERFTITSLYKKASHELSLIQHEVSILKQLSHPNIIKFEDAFEDNLVFHEVTEETSGISLLDLLMENQKLNELATRKIVKKILKALQFLHEKSICYGNLCMDTIKILNNQVKLIDFTKARKINEENSLSIGNYNFMPPECFAENCNEKLDMWSVGVITYYLLQGFLPFEGKEKVEIVGNISKARYRTNGLSDLSKAFISKLLVVDPDKRITAQEALKEPWLMNLLELN